VTDWKQIKEEYLAGGVGYRALAAKNGVGYGTLAEIAKKENWTALKKQRQNTQGNALADGACRDGSEETAVPAASEGEGAIFSQQTHDTEITALVDKLLARLSFFADDEDLDTQGLKQLVSVLKDLREIREAPLETAIQLARLRKLERELTSDEEVAHEVTVVFRAGSEAWNE